MAGHHASPTRLPNPYSTCEKKTKRRGGDARHPGRLARHMSSEPQGMALSPAWEGCTASDALLRIKQALPGEQGQDLCPPTPPRTCWRRTDEAGNVKPQRSVHHQRLLFDISAPRRRCRPASPSGHTTTVDTRTCCARTELDRGLDAQPRRPPAPSVIGVIFGGARRPTYTLDPDPATPASRATATAPCSRAVQRQLNTNREFGHPCASLRRPS